MTYFRQGQSLQNNSMEGSMTVNRQTKHRHDLLQTNYRQDK